jgi:peptide/nickel transport system substrate-binding protein
MIKPLLTVCLASLVLSIGCRSADAPATPASSSAPASGGDLVASVRSEPATYNRLLPNGQSAATELFTLLTQSRLARVNRVTDELEAWLAEAWTLGADGLTYTMTLRPDVKFSDGHPFTTDDVLFSFRVVYDPGVNSSLADSMKVNGAPIEVTARDARTLTLRFPEVFAPGLRMLDNLPILPKHRLEAAFAKGELAKAWSPSRPLSEIAGLGPFVLAEHVAGQRLVFTRNPHYFRRDAKGIQLPYLDRLTLAVTPDQNTEALRLEAAEVDLMMNADVRPQDHAAFKRLADQGKLRMMDVSVALDPDFLSFNLRPARAAQRRAPWMNLREFRQAISCGVDRQAIVNAVYLGAAVPIYGPITPGNKRWYSADAPSCPIDRDKARALLAGAGLTDRNGDGLVDDASGKPARFSIITHAGHLRERVSSVLQEQLRQLGIQVDVVALDPGGIAQRWQAGDYDAIYFGLQASATDPSLSPEFWYSAGSFHFWNPSQKSPATPWEQRIDELMREVATTPDLPQRQRAFAEVQKIFGEELPSIYFVAARVSIATTARVLNPTPAPQIPQLLWSADTLARAR